MTIAKVIALASPVWQADRGDRRERNSLIEDLQRRGSTMVARRWI